MALEQRAGHLPEVDPQVLDPVAVGNGEVRGDANQKLVQRQARGSDRDNLSGLETSKIRQLRSRGETGEDVIRPEDGAQVQQGIRYAR